MRIAMISPLEMRVPPVGYGGTELVVSLLTEGLVRAGHEVTLFASGDSETAAALVPGAPRFLRGSSRHKGILELLNVVRALERAGQFDIIHNHTALEGMATAGLVSTPMLTTLHGGMDGDWRLLLAHYRGWFNAISHSALALLPPKERCVGVIHNAIDVPSYPFNPGAREDFVLFLSRMSPEKGPDLAIEVARRSGVRVVLAGNVDACDREFFETRVRPAVDGRQIEYRGEADYRAKRELLSRARCLLAPITWEEPFGLFMAEANACGTPVVAMRRGAAPEVIADGETGYLVDSVEEMCAALGRVEAIEARACRAHVERHFSAERMVRDYLAAYRRVLAASGTRTPSERAA